jgi:hypothetical protein
METRFIIPSVLAVATAMLAIALNLLFGLTLLILPGLCLFFTVVAYDQYSKNKFIVDGLGINKRNLQK